MLLFSPKYKFTEIDWNDKKMKIDAFEDSVKEFYLKPAHNINMNGCGFATGLLCLTTIDVLARIASGKEKVDKTDYKGWVKDNIPEFNDELALRLYENFRCGLVHEGRIKNCGQFSYDINTIVDVANGVMLINSHLLLGRIIEALQEYINNIRKNDETFRKFSTSLIRDFKNDIHVARIITARS